MLYVHGRQLNLNIECPFDKHLFIDIDRGDLSELLTLPPTTTYIITTRSLAELEEYIAKGYFNIVVVSSASKITTRFIAEFIQQTYIDNQFKIVSQRLSELYRENGATLADLQRALQALHDDDAVTFADIMSSSLSDILEDMSSIDAMIAYCKSFAESKESVEQLRKDAAQLETVSADREHFRTLYEQELAKKTALDTELSEAQKIIGDLRLAASQQVVTNDQVKNSKLYLDLKAQHDAAVSERQIAEQALTQLQDEMNERVNLLSSGAKEDVILRLKKELAAAQSASFDKIIEGKLPVLQDSTLVDAEHIMYFKEVRPTVYINSLVRWMNAYLRTRYEGMMQKQFLIIVFDPLIDQYTVSKYAKHNWAINSMPEATDRVLITNTFDFTKLKKDFMINKYNLLVIFDRCHLMKNAVTMSRAKSFYFVNTPNDISDYNLNPQECIGFFQSIGAGKNIIDSKYHISPWSDELIADSIDKRSGKLTSDMVFSRIFAEMGIGGE